MELNELHDRLLKMLEFFHKFCKAHDLKYYAIGGTALGAVRHNGFIPWDDDVDLGIPRKDYAELLRLMEKEKGQYVIESLDFCNEGYCYPYAKIYDTNTTLIENTKKAIKRGIYIDVFPLDGAGESEEEARKHSATIERKKKFLGLRIIKINRRRAWYKNLLLWAVQLAPQCVINDVKLCHKIDYLCRQKEYESCALVGNLNGAWGQREIVKRAFFGVPQLHRFENISIYIPEQYEEYLSGIYGDWRKLPPEEKRVSHHDYILMDLSKPYR